MTAAAVLTTGLLAGCGSSNAGAGTIPAETTISGTTVEAQTAGEDAGTEGEKAADGESTGGRCEGAETTGQAVCLGNQRDTPVGSALRNFYGLPGLGITLDAFPSAVVVFSVNTGAYASETTRAAIEAVPAGQLEAGYCVGLSYTQTMMRIILPQALRIAFPPLSNSLIGLVKDTSLAANITVMEMFMSAQRIAARTYEPFALYCEVGIIYLIFCTALTRLQSVWEQKLRLE